MNSEFTECLETMAELLITMMRMVGGNPNEPAEVESFVNGCAISKKLKTLIIEGSDDE